MRFTILLAAVALALAALPAEGGEITLSLGGGATRHGSSWGGGEFWVSSSSGLPDVDADDGWVSFCLERSETFTPGKSMSATYGTAAELGSEGSYDPLDYETAYLYTEFRNETLDGYSFVAGSDARKDSAVALQLVIWFFENELAIGNTTELDDMVIGDFSKYSSHVDDDLFDLIKDFIGDARDAVADEDIWGETLGGVRVINPSSNGKARQSQLMIVEAPVPPAAFGGLLLLAGLGIARARRRRRRLRV
jgi:hypothetical protein